MSEQKRKIGFTVACVNEFANRYKMSSKEAFQYLFQFKGITFIKENYDVEHTLDFETILDDLEILCKKMEVHCEIISREQYSDLYNLRIKNFGIRTTEECARFVMNNRSRAFTDMKDVLCNKDNKYEIVIGPVADDNMALKKGNE